MMARQDNDIGERLTRIEQSVEEWLGTLKC
jgi:hypothetical protein